MLRDAIKQLPTFAARTYKGGAVMREFLGEQNAKDNFYPEDWISSFVTAKNKVYVENEGITRVEYNGEIRLITDVVGVEDFGQGRLNSSVLIKLLDSAQRLGIQVHPTTEFARDVFNSSFGKTECWYILGKRSEDASVYLGFKEHVTRQLWAELFQKQDIEGMLSCLHNINVTPGDVILVTGGTPHAIGEGCFMVEIQEPSDYTMRVEKVTVDGEVLTPKQIHYGAGEDKLLDCFDYTPRTLDEVRSEFVLTPTRGQNGQLHLVKYSDTECFALSLVDGCDFGEICPSFVTVIVLEDGGEMLCNSKEYPLKRGEKYFVPANIEYKLKDAKALLCYPGVKGIKK